MLLVIEYDDNDNDDEDDDDDDHDEDNDYDDIYHYNDGSGTCMLLVNYPSQLNGKGSVFQ